ncbi:hypothetical protein N7462_011012 [Penicillium macrosclerotiorum]|uniref:uncharacterized protein n=1 Tax=Penicillium macrosclerotiorum TaxID=303699 RepID=UPI0025495029|nr:uncharacterized protein N7462_011012 [Penicillium macrosclerotiorum]KAJ5666603.1 hypothetical protein N7462_011012 [Penicillium macrosclerotiorum]
MIRAIFSTFCLLVPLYWIYKPPAILIHYLHRRWPDVLWRHPTRENVVALTIDDTPSTQTRAILALLRDHDATATFFIIGSQVPGHEKDLTDLVRTGNELANHAMYDEPSRGLSDAVLAEQITTVHSMIQQAYSASEKETGPDNWLFRPGSGFFSSRMRSLIQQLGYRLVLGDVYPHDPQIPFAKLNAKHILDMTRPGSIIICHDRREWTLPMLRIVLPELRRRGYRVRTVSELLREPLSK